MGEESIAQKPHTRRQSGRWEEKDDRGNRTSCEHSEEQGWKKKKKYISSEVGTNRRSKGVEGGEGSDSGLTLWTSWRKCRGSLIIQRPEKKDAVQRKRKQVGYCETIS